MVEGHAAQQTVVVLLEVGQKLATGGLDGEFVLAEPVVQAAEEPGLHCA